MQPQNETPLLQVDDLQISFKGENKQWIETVKGISKKKKKNQNHLLIRFS